MWQRRRSPRQASPQAKNQQVFTDGESPEKQRAGAAAELPAPDGRGQRQAEAADGPISRRTLRHRERGGGGEGHRDGRRPGGAQRVRQRLGRRDVGLGLGVRLGGGGERGHRGEPQTAWRQRQEAEEESQHPGPGPAGGLGGVTDFLGPFFFFLKMDVCWTSSPCQVMRVKLSPRTNLLSYLREKEGEGIIHLHHGLNPAMCYGHEGNQ